MLLLTVTPEGAKFVKLINVPFATVVDFDPEPVVVEPPVRRNSVAELVVEVGVVVEEVLEPVLGGVVKIWLQAGAVAAMMSADDPGVAVAVGPGNGVVPESMTQNPVKFPVGSRIIPVELKKFARS